MVMTRLGWRRWCCFGLSLFLALGPSAETDGSIKRLTVDDLLGLEQVGDVSFSPDGNWIAYVIKRRKAAAGNYGRYVLDGNDRADVWLVPAKGGSSVNLTNGVIDGSGFWNPVWSPDSERLAVFSTRGGNVRLWIVELRSGHLNRLMESATDPDAGSPVWLSDTQIGFAVLPMGAKPGIMIAQAAETAMHEWPKAWAGREVTASVLNSGVDTEYKSRARGALCFVDLVRGNTQVVAEGTFGDLTLSPDKRHFAALETVDLVKPRIDEKVIYNWWRSRQQELVIFSIEGKRLPLARRPPALLAPSISIQWGPSGRGLLLIGKRPFELESEAYLYRISGEDVPLAANDLTFSDTSFPIKTIWSPVRSIVYQARAKPTAERSVGNRTDWWVLTDFGRVKNLTAQFSEPPAELVPEPNGTDLVGLADGKLWRISILTKSVTSLTASEFGFTSLIRPFDRESPNGISSLIVETHRATELGFCEVELASGRIKLLPKPHADAGIVSYDPRIHKVLFTADTRDGSFLWLVSSDTVSAIARLNRFLAEISANQPIKLEYRGLDGQNLKAWLILPPDYQAGRRYPMVVWVYAGSTEGNESSLGWIQSRLNSMNEGNMQLMAARGYLVLFPSMPLPSSEVRDPYLELTKGVLPAVDKAIDLGYADPMRLGLMGHSFGGYTVYGLVTQTARFKAAVSLGGLSDLVSSYGIFNTRTRYGQFPHEDLFGPWYWEAGNGRLGSPPWKDVSRYVLNSPIFHADRVETPLMIVQGDMDYVGMEQGEEFFTALYRQGKRAQFIRYWGESHLLDSPTNIKDKWHRLYAWFDEFLDVSRDQEGNLFFQGSQVKSRNGASPLTQKDFTRFEEKELLSHPWVARANIVNAQ